MTDWCDHPVLVYGPRKAGTTLLQSLLDGGPYVMTPGELKLKYLIDYDSRGLEQGDREYVPRARSALQQNRVRWVVEDGTRRLERDEPFVLGVLEESELEGRFDAGSYIRSLERSFSTPPSSLKRAIVADVAGFVNAMKTDGPPRGWAAKEVGGDPAEFVPEFRRMFPEAKFVFIVRDPRFVVRSVILDRRRKGIKLGAREIAWQWRSVMKVLRYLAEAKEADDSVLVRYEDLVHDTEEVMRAITGFLGVPFDDSYTLPTVLGVPSRVATSSKDTRRVFKTSTVNWRSELRWSETTVLRACSSLSTARDRMRDPDGRVLEAFRGGAS